MNIQTLSTKQFWVALTAVGLTSFSAGYYSDVPEPVAPEVVTETQEVEVVKEVENTERLEQLKAIDEQIFEQSGIVIDAQSQALTIAGEILGQYPNFNLDDINTGSEIIQEQTARIETASAEVDRLRVEREQVLQ